MPVINPDLLQFHDLVFKWFKECTPKVLVVTDGLNYQSASSFGLTEFVAALRASTIHGMTPIVITAQYNATTAAALTYDAANKHITNYKFKDATHGLLKSRYDVVFLLGINGSGGPRLIDEAGALDAVTAFMQAGGGVFATGDHDDLGAGMCKDIPRVRNMRYWTTGTPSASGINRLTTTMPGRGDVPGSNDVYEFGDQSDQFPQRLYVNFRSDAGGVGNAHPLLQVPGVNRAIEVFPDHPHEGECIIPASLTTKLQDGATDEWPVATGGGARVSPEMVALTMSHGNAMISSGKAAVVPRSFIAMCAYNGQAANVGRVVTDATWHHFVNINIKPSMADIAGRDLADIKQYYVNIANWLMPKNVRKCSRYPWVLTELVRYPLFEEFVPIPRKQLDGPAVRNMGEQVAAALSSNHTRSDVESFIDDALDDVIGIDVKNKLEELARETGLSSVRTDLGFAAIGAVTLATAELFNELQNKGDVDGDAVFSKTGKEAAAFGVKLYLSYTRKNLDKLGELISSIKC